MRGLREDQVRVLMSKVHEMDAAVEDTLLPSGSVGTESSSAQNILMIHGTCFSYHQCCCAEVTPIRTIHAGCHSVGMVHHHTN